VASSRFSSDPPCSRMHASTFPSIIYFAMMSLRQGANMSKNQANQSHLLSSGLGTAIDSELTVLASIEARYAHELTRLESSGTPPSVKERLRQQLDARRKMARKPHVLRLAELYAEAQTRELFSRNTRH
jgi:hypothetical protein